VKERYRFNAFVEIEDVIFLVGGVEVVTVQTKSHEYNLDAQLLFKKRANGNAASSSDGYR
jgi:hypothetical protein